MCVRGVGVVRAHCDAQNCNALPFLMGTVALNRVCSTGLR